MFRAKHQPSLTPFLFSLKKKKKKKKTAPIPTPTCLSTVNNTRPAVGARHLLLPGSRLLIGRRSDKQTRSRWVQVLTATHSRVSSAPLLRNPTTSTTSTTSTAVHMLRFLFWLIAFPHWGLSIFLCACACVRLYFCLFCSLKKKKL